MCGISGAVWLPQTRPVDTIDFDRATDTLAHRGPDGRGIHRCDHDDGSGVLLGHRRLSIIDLGGGAQPMCNEDRTVWIAFNGEIYNYRELRPALEQQGHRFRTHSDTETIVHLYEQYDEQFLQHLRGMFAIAIWDANRRRLILARDRMGQKPLVYQFNGQRLLFASEIKAILSCGDAPPTVRPAAVDEYLTYGYVPHPQTIFQGIHKLPPAHYAVFERGQLHISRYWHPDLTPDPNIRQSTIRDELTATLQESVKLRLRSDVPLGAFLSGGIDSTVICGLMQRHSQRPTNTYTIGFPVDGFDESAFAQQAADHLGTNHHLLEVTPDSLDTLSKLVWFFDEPFADSSALPTYYVSQLTRQHVTVALTGDGGDELFAGYPRYQTIERLGRFDRLPILIRRMATGPWVDWIPSGPQRSIRQRLKHRLQILRDPASRRYVNWLTEFPRPLRASFYQPEFASEIDPDASLAPLLQAMQPYAPCSPGIAAMRTDMTTYLPDDLLVKVDITSMAHGLEARSPFLDHHVVELVGKIPFDLLATRGKIKPLLTTVFSDLIPHELQSRPKMGFSVPLDRWFRDDLHGFARETLMASDAFCHRYFRPEAIRTLLDQHQSHHWNHGDRIWSLLFFELWGKALTLRPRLSPRSAPAIASR